MTDRIAEIEKWATDATADVLFAAAHDRSTRDIVLVGNPAVSLREVLRTGAKRIDSLAQALAASEARVKSAEQTAALGRLRAARKAME